MSTLQTRPATGAVEKIVELAGRAPSVHNTQPWRWRVSGDASDVLELHADRSRQLPVEDPTGRNLTISCGAALHHAQLAASATGWTTTVDRLPDRTDSSLLARLHLRPTAPSSDAAEVVAAIEQRCTDRRRFTSWPVPDERLAHLASRAGAWGTRALPLVDVSERFRAELLVHRALDHQSTDPRVLQEQAAWVDHGATDGVPSGVLPAPDEVATRRPGRFVAGLVEEVGGRELESSDGLIVLCTADDDAAAWLRTGEGLSALWLAATTEGLSVVPLSQVVEVPETRDALRTEVLGGLANPQILVRVGWQAISRTDLPRTGRRPVQDVLDLG